MLNKNEMSSLERVLAVIARKEFDVFPAISPTSVVTVESMRMAKAFYPSAHTNPNEMANLAAVGHDYFGFDTVSPYFSIHLEAAALGAQIDWNDVNTTPKVVKKPMKRIDDFVLPTSFLSRNEFQSLIKTCKLLKKRYGNSVAVVGKVVGPWTLAYNLYGVENLIIDTILEPEKTKQLISELATVSLEFAKAQFEAGADIITWADHVTSDLVSAQIYEEFVMPIHKRASFTLQKYGPVILHVCGNVMDRLPLIAKTGFKLFHMDSRNDIVKALELVGDDILLTGCINNPLTLAQSTPNMVRNEVKNNLRSGIKLISPECAIPCSVPAKNLKELVDTAHKYKPGDIIS